MPRAAIVTGGNDCIGRGIAIGLAKAGASVCIAGRNEEKNERVRLEIEQIGAPSMSLCCDVGYSVS
ncbi:MAG: SDR family NAD(P)-dependent oxidoreductase [Gemmatimonadetes bacterium]|nr:SDR family NAD(P)-dependent oxidoreductase [Gemmatimonadota bacterium]